METSINQSSMLRVGTILHDTYRIEGYLASGGFGNTYVAFNIQFGERCAIKEFFLKGMTQRVDKWCKRQQCRQHFHLHGTEGEV